MAKKLKEFVVQGTNIADEEGNKCRPGSNIMLTKKSAIHYHKLGYIAIPVGDFYGDDNEEEVGNSDGEDTEETVSKPASDSKRSKSRSRISSAAADASN